MPDTNLSNSTNTSKGYVCTLELGRDTWNARLPSDTYKILSTAEIPIRYAGDCSEKLHVFHIEIISSQVHKSGASLIGVNWMQALWIPGSPTQVEIISKSMDHFCEISKQSRTAFLDSYLDGDLTQDDLLMFSETDIDPLCLTCIDNPEQESCPECGGAHPDKGSVRRLVVAGGQETYTPQDVGTDARSYLKHLTPTDIERLGVQEARWVISRRCQFYPTYFFELGFHETLNCVPWSELNNPSTDEKKEDPFKYTCLKQEDSVHLSMITSPGYTTDADPAAKDSHSVSSILADMRRMQKLSDKLKKEQQRDLRKIKELGGFSDPKISKCLEDCGFSEPKLSLVRE